MRKLLRKFWGKGTIPLPLRTGDYLVTRRFVAYILLSEWPVRYPDAGEIYLSRHGEEAEVQEKRDIMIHIYI